MYKMKYKKIMYLRDIAMLHLVITNSSVATFQNDQRDFYDKKSNITDTGTIIC